MQKSTNFELNVPEGSDKFAPLSDFNPNWTKIDSQMKLNEDNSIPTATEAVAGTVHNIIRNKPDASMFRFTATGDVKDGDTFTVDGVSVQAVLPNGQGVTAGSYLVNSQVLACVVGSQLTIYTSAASGGAVDAATLEGHPADYFATKTEVEGATTIATAARNVADNAKSTADEALQAAQSAGFNMVEVWRNPDSTAIFNSKSISLSTEAANAKMFLIGVNNSGGSTLAVGHYNIVEATPNSENSRYNQPTLFTPGTSGKWWARDVRVDTKTSLWFSPGYDSTGNENTRGCVPMIIWALY